MKLNEFYKIIDPFLKANNIKREQVTEVILRPQGYTIRYIVTLEPSGPNLPVNLNATTTSSLDAEYPVAVHGHAAAKPVAKPAAPAVSIAPVVPPTQ